MTAPAIRFDDDTWTAEQVDQQARALASALSRLGVGPGHRVALLLRNDPRFLIATRAIGLIGAVPVPLNWHNTAPEVAYLLEDSEATAVVVHTSLVASVEGCEVPVILVPDAEAGEWSPSSTVVRDWDHLVADSLPWSEPPATPAMSMIYTSGTTGRPKGVHRDVPNAEQAAVVQRIVAATFDLRPDDRTLIPAPLYHSAPNVHASLALGMGVPLTLMSRFDAERFLALVQQYRITHAQLVPTMFVKLLQLPEEIRASYDVSSLRSVVHAAAPCPAYIKRQMIDWWGPIINEYYGGTETGPVVHCTSEEWLAHPGTVGKTVETATVRIRREDGTWADPGETGDVYMRLGCWPNFTYHRDPAKRAGVEHEGLITCGDIGHLDDDRYLYLTDRASDVVIAGGVNIYPAEVEAALMQVPGVRDCAAFGIPDATLGEILIAHVDADEALTEESILASLEGNLARYKIPRRVVLDDALPREASGKLLKRRLRERYREASNFVPDLQPDA